MTEKSFWKQMENFPYTQLTLLCLLRLGEPLVFTSIFSYIFFMIKDFGITKDILKISTYAGYLSSSFAIFQFLFCVQHAQASNKYGRKPILLFGVFGTGISSILFGFSSNFLMAMIARSLMGALNGNISVLRVAVGEIAVEKKHQNIAFSILATTWNIGAVIGPLIGSYHLFTRPKIQIENYNEFVNKYPYAMSNIVFAGYLFFSLILGFLFLEEPSEEFKGRRDYGLELGNWILKKLGFKKSKSRKGEDEEQADEEEREVLLSANQVYSSLEEDEEEVIDNTLVSARYGEAARRRYSSEQLGPVISNNHVTTNVPESYFTREVFTGPVIQSVISNFLLCFHAVLYSEFLPVLLASQLINLKWPFTIAGGYGWSSESIGKLLSSTGIIGTIAVIILFPILDHHLKTVTILRLSFVLIPIAYASLPYFLFFNQDYDASNPSWLSAFCIYLVALILSTVVSISFCVSMIMVHRSSAIPSHRAFINGAGISLNSLARGISPILFGHFMTWCNENEIGGLPWFVLGLIALICLIQSFFMDEYDGV
ncbi:uncharacterized protein KGF55_000548 [Candida pseudojiufengensis]|uniref:uncharacterized protein n=1 Tax=Candida pseudojiufengensis TaxID=497109 RepID=UPI002224BB53|nr:uncharacterized protein KGF55_000548 [Candida pseudojiufengensis]KAI5966239.1 hypothetical protein KGF55_000548 [Candida pseudojiufengensis]